MKRVLFVDQSQVLGGAELSLIDIAKEFPGSAVAVFAAGEFSNRLAELDIDHRILNVPRSLTDVKRSGGIISEALAVPALLSTALIYFARRQRFRHYLRQYPKGNARVSDRWHVVGKTSSVAPSRSNDF